MFRSSQFRKLVLCIGMGLATIAGSPVRPDEIEDLLRDAARAKIVFQIDQTKEE